MKAKNPVNKGRLGPDMPLTTNTVHEKGYMSTRQEDGSYSELRLTINEFYTDDIWIGIEVDGKFHDLTFMTEKIFNKLKELV